MGKGVPEVMNTRSTWDRAYLKQAVEGRIDGAMMQASGSPVDEKRSVWPAGPDLQPFCQVVLKGLTCGRAQRHKAGLSELAFGNVEDLFCALEVLHIQSQGLAYPDSRGVKKPQKRPVGMRPKGMRRRQVRCGRKEHTDLGTGIDIGPVSLSGGNSSQWFGHKAVRIASRHILAQLSDYREAVGAAARGKARKPLQI